MTEEMALTGGRAGGILRRGGTVVRPARAWTPYVHLFLRYLRGQVADFVPEPCGINAENEEVLSYMSGEVYNYPLPEALLSEAALVSAAGLLRRFHDYGEPFIASLTGTEPWMLPAAHPIQVMCHGDFAPYNVTTVNSVAVGIIDFDTLHPGPRIEDIAYAIYRWVPFTAPDDETQPFGLSEHIARTKLFMDAYEATQEERRSFVPALVERLHALLAFMQAEADKGNRDFKQNITDGHMLRYENDIANIKRHADIITRGV